MIATLASGLLNTLGWTLDIEFPDAPKYVLIVYPHTSNWDFPLGVTARHAIRLKAHYIAKHTLFKKPFGWLFRGLGGIPVDRGKKENTIRQIAARFDAAEEFVLGMAPEGTRSKTDHWKSGFYHIARAAKVPIAMAYFDYPKKKIGLGGAFYPSESINEAYEQIRTFFHGKQGKNPDQQGTIQPRPGR